MTGLEATRLTPAELINALLRAEVDLLWFGGIGTYVKWRVESDADAAIAPTMRSAMASQVTPSAWRRR